MKKYDWMHPSYRDLVIEELVEDQELRLQFLHTVGLEGLKLALSDRGGVNGERIHPLVIDEASKLVVKERILEIANSSEVYQAKPLLEILVNATKQSNKNSEWLHEILGDVFQILNKNWNRQVIWVATLETYCEASLLLRPLPPIPDLEPTWKSVVSDVHEALREDLILEPYPIQSWIEFIELVKQNEPRFLRQVNFPSLYLELTQKIHDQLEIELSTELLSPTKDEIRDEAERIYALADCATALGSLFGEFRLQFNKLSRLLREKYEELMNVLEPEEEDLDDESASLHADRDFDIDAVFVDL